MGKASNVPVAIVRGVDRAWLRESSVRKPRWCGRRTKTCSGESEQFGSHCTAQHAERSPDESPSRRRTAAQRGSLRWHWHPRQWAGACGLLALDGTAIVPDLGALLASRVKDEARPAAQCFRAPARRPLRSRGRLANVLWDAGSRAHYALRGLLGERDGARGSANHVRLPLVAMVHDLAWRFACHMPIRRGGDAGTTQRFAELRRRRALGGAVAGSRKNGLARRWAVRQRTRTQVTVIEEGADHMPPADAALLRLLLLRPWHRRRRNEFLCARGQRRAEKEPVALVRSVRQGAPATPRAAGFRSSSDSMKRWGDEVLKCHKRRRLAGSGSRRRCSPAQQLAARSCAVRAPRRRIRASRRPRRWPPGHRWFRATMPLRRRGERAGRGARRRLDRRWSQLAVDKRRCTSQRAAPARLSHALRGLTRKEGCKATRRDVRRPVLESLSDHRMSPAVKSRWSTWKRFRLRPARCGPLRHRTGAALAHQRRQVRDGRCFRRRDDAARWNTVLPYGPQGVAVAPAAPEAVHCESCGSDSGSRRAICSSSGLEPRGDLRAALHASHPARLSPSDRGHGARSHDDRTDPEWHERSKLPAAFSLLCDTQCRSRQRRSSSSATT